MDIVGMMEGRAVDRDMVSFRPIVGLDMSVGETAKDHLRWQEIEIVVLI